MTIEFSRKEVRAGDTIKGNGASFLVGSEQDGKVLLTVTEIRVPQVMEFLSVGDNIPFEKNPSGFTESLSTFNDPDVGLIRLRIGLGQVIGVVLGPEWGG